MLVLLRPLYTNKKLTSNSLDSQQNPSIHVAAQCDKEDVVLTLIEEFSCDPNIRDYLGRSLLHSACAGGKVSLVCKLILDYNADVNIQDDQGNTPLKVAVLNSQESLASALIGDSELNVKSYQNRSILHVACSLGNVDFVKTLLHKQPADITSQDDQQNTPLHVAALCGKEEMVLSLITKCDFNAKGFLGRSLLHSACSGGNVSLVQKLILDYNADVNTLDDQGNTPLDVAV